MVSQIATSGELHVIEFQSHVMWRTCHHVYMESWTAFATSSTHKHTFTYTYKHMQTHPALQQAAIRPMHHVQVTILYAIDSRMYFVRRIFDSISTPFEQLYVLIEPNCSVPKAPFTSKVHVPPTFYNSPPRLWVNPFKLRCLQFLRWGRRNWKKPGVTERRQNHPTISIYYNMLLCCYKTSWSCVITLYTSCIASPYE